jgi:hypothetical protein
MFLLAALLGLLVSASLQTTTAEYKRIIESRLKLEALSFKESVELFELIDRITPQIQEPARAEFDLFRLRALDRSLREIMAYEPKDPAHQNWIVKHEDAIAYSEPAGQWLVRPGLFWALEARHRGNPAAEPIAWEAANANLPGECEGYIPCTLAVLLMTDGRYLELYPKGAHVAEALERIDYPLREIVKPGTHYAMDRRDNAELRESIEKLSAIVDRTSGPQKADILTTCGTGRTGWTRRRPGCRGGSSTTVSAAAGKTAAEDQAERDGFRVARTARRL